MQNIRDREIQAIGKMLALSHGGQSANLLDFGEQWKVLIYDHDGRDIISPLLNVGALRQKGVTLHMMLHTEREAIPDAPVVYFVRPTEANLKRIAEDCTKQLYRAVYLNFITRIDRNLLEKFAQDLVASNSAHMISKIYDQYLDTISLEPNLFTLNIKDAFMQYNEQSLSESQIRSFMNRVAMGLLSTVRVMGSLPVIRCQPGGAAEMLSQELFSLAKDVLSPRNPAQALFEDCLVHDRARPLLLIVDRTNDLFPMLQHNSTYLSLISDLLDFKLNRVTVDTADKNSTTPKKKTYDLNSANDAFLSHYSAAPFPEAVDANEKELNEVSQKESAIRSRPDFAKLVAGGDMMNADVMMANLEGKGKDLSEAIEHLPEILSKKALLEAHTNIMQGVMKQIATREIPTYFELEQSLLTASSLRSIDKTAVLGLLKDGTKGTIGDKIRLLAILSMYGVSSEGGKTLLDEYDSALQAGCAAMTPPISPEEIAQAMNGIVYLRRLLSLQSPFSSGGIGSGGGRNASGGGQNALLSTFLTAAHGKAASLIAKAATYFTKFTPYYVTRVIDNLAEGREDDHFITLDPRSTTAGGGAMSGGSSQSSANATGTKYSEVIVFVLGGGCYSEYDNLQELLKEKATSTNHSLRHITYGCTDLICGDEFMEEIDRLANPTATTTTAGST